MNIEGELKPSLDCGLSRMILKGDISHIIYKKLHGEMCEVVLESSRQDIPSPCLNILRGESGVRSKVNVAFHILSTRVV